MIRLDVASRTLSLLVSDEELAARAARRGLPPPPKFERGFGLLYSRHVQQADVGCDFDFLETTHSAGRNAEPEIH